VSFGSGIVLGFLSHFSQTTLGEAEMTEEKRAELYSNPGGKFIRSDTLSRILAHWRSFRPQQKRLHFIKYEGELYEAEEVDKLMLPLS
jgi:hypothetical protein